MSTKAAMAFAQRILTDQDFQLNAAGAIEGKAGTDVTDALIQFGSRGGLEITAEELLTVRDALTGDDRLSDKSLDLVVGGSEDDQLTNVDLGNILQQQQGTLQMMSNISKQMYDTAMSIIRKIGG